MTPRERTNRLVGLYQLRGKVDLEIAAIEEAMTREQMTVAAARSACEIPRESRARCGTDAGYYRHLRKLKESACGPCLIAHRLAERGRRKRREEAVA